MTEILIKIECTDVLTRPADCDGEFLICMLDAFELEHSLRSKGHPDSINGRSRKFLQF